MKTETQYKYISGNSANLLLAVRCFVLRCCPLSNCELTAVGYGKDCLDEKLPLSRYCVPIFKKTTV
jgi:hypothetical protein